MKIPGMYVKAQVKETFGRSEKRKHNFSTVYMEKAEDECRFKDINKWIWHPLLFVMMIHLRFIISNQPGWDEQREEDQKMRDKWGSCAFSRQKGICSGSRRGIREGGVQTKTPGVWRTISHWWGWKEKNHRWFWGFWWLTPDKQHRKCVQVPKMTPAEQM